MPWRTECVDGGAIALGTTALSLSGYPRQKQRTGHAASPATARHCPAIRCAARAVAPGKHHLERQPAELRSGSRESSQETSVTDATPAPLPYRQLAYVNRLSAASNAASTGITVIFFAAFLIGQQTCRT
jgi:hypothetical protein